MSYPKHLKPMPLSVVTALGSCDMVHVWWAKDDDPENVRINKVEEINEVTHRNGVFTISTDDGDDEIRQSEIDANPDTHIAIGIRGAVHYFYPPDTPRIRMQKNGEG